MTTKPRVLIVNDDGPPSASSPYVLQLFQELVAFGWDVRVVLPSSQKSWSGTNYTVHDAQLRYWYYYPIRDNFDGSHPDTQRCWSNTRRAIDHDHGEIAEWTPSTCANIGLFTGNTLFGTPDAPPISLIVSGPNYGRNTGTAFSVSSGTLGGALAGALSDVRGVAISYGHFRECPPCLDGRTDAPRLTPDEETEMRMLASRHSASILAQLWEHWDADAAVEVYAMNVPLCECLREPKVVWTRIWPSRHVQQYVPPAKSHDDDSARVRPLGVSPLPVQHAEHGSYLDFRPNLARAMRPGDGEALEEGTDVWALCQGYIGISRLVASFAQVDSGGRAPPQCA